MHWLLFIYPVLAAALTRFLSHKRSLDLLVLFHAILHLGLAAEGFLIRGTLGGMDDLGLFVFIITSVLYMAVAIYKLGESDDAPAHQYRIHTICLMLFIAAMDGACIVKDLGWIWVFVEATTLASAMLISSEHHKSSVEAAWKYLFICSLGIALAFVGILLLVIAQPETATLSMGTLIRHTSLISSFWLKLSFVFIMVGFGTKVGLAPLHFWLPDAHSEAPAPISALLSGALLNTALIPILRMDKLMKVAGLATTAQSVYLIFGFLSLFIATVFILKTKNYKRMLAYSSIENMGFVMLAFGAGGIAIFAGFLHILGHSLIKSAMFLTAGNILRIYKDKLISNVKGLLNTHKTTAWLWLTGTAMITGFPPSPLFMSKFLIITALLSKGYYIGVAAVLFMVATIVWSMSKTGLTMTMGDTKKDAAIGHLSYLVPAGLLLIAAIIGIWPPALD